MDLQVASKGVSFSDKELVLVERRLGKVLDKSEVIQSQGSSATVYQYTLHFLKYGTFPPWLTPLGATNTPQEGAYAVAEDIVVAISDSVARAYLAEYSQSAAGLSDSLLPVAVVSSLLPTRSFERFRNEGRLRPRGRLLPTSRAHAGKPEIIRAVFLYSVSSTMD